MASNTLLSCVRSRLQYQAPTCNTRPRYNNTELCSLETIPVYLHAYSARDDNTTPNIVYQTLHNDTKLRSRETTILSPTMQYQATVV